jgi:hypothetical protein
MMRFRTPREDTEQDRPAKDCSDEEERRVQRWQWEGLGRLGYDADTASLLVTAAWVHGEHTDLVHRIEQLIGRGATLDQAARIVVPVASLCAASPD